MKESPKGDYILRGPPTASRKPGIHHLEARIQDAIPRYKTMRGYRAERRGWDTRLAGGAQVEKELGFTGSPTSRSAASPRSIRNAAKRLRLYR